MSPCYTLWTSHPAEPLFWLAVIGVGVGVPALGLVLLRWRQRLKDQELRATLGSPVSTIQGRHRPDRLTLRGRLLANGSSISRFDDGAPAAAASISAARPPMERVVGNAADLTLQVGEEQVELAAPAQLLLGSRAIRSRRPLNLLDQATWDRATQACAESSQTLADRKVVFHSVDPDDEVLVCGLLTQLADTEGQAAYRRSAHRWALVAGSHTLQMMAASEPRRNRRPVRKTAITLLSAALAAAILVALTGVGAGRARRLIWGESTWQAFIRKAKLDNICRETVECRIFGECSGVLQDEGTALERLRCVALDDRDCRSSSNCRIHRQCSARDESCY